MVSKILHAEQLPLHGKHLIEASAGTGKTFNIARIYLRMLLEKRLTVQQILVMTFTRAATEELRGRIRAEIFTLLNKWNSVELNDNFHQHLFSIVTSQQAKIILNNALLHMDESAIFTIHGFCSRVLTEHAFSSGLEFNLQMEADTKALELEAVRDWYRKLSKSSPENYQIIFTRWPQPEKFYQALSSCLSGNSELLTHSEADYIEVFFKKKQACKQQLIQQQDYILDAVINGRKDEDKRYAQWQLLLSWLDDNSLSIIEKDAKASYGGGRLNGASDPDAIKQLFSETKMLDAETKASIKLCTNAAAFSLAAKAIPEIKTRIDQTKTQAHMMSFDDLISHLFQTLTNEVDEPQLAQAILSQYPVALVDEFQDTDPQQFSILSTIYNSETLSDTSAHKSTNAMYMIGDPKQAIYAFRGGDIFAYLAARKQVTDQWLMNVNWRSSSTMIAGYNRLFFGKTLPDELQNQESNSDVFGYDISYNPVQSAGKADETPLIDNANNSALNLVYFPYNEEFRNKRGLETVTAQYRPVIAQWCANEIVRLFTNKVQIGARSLRENDISILVRDKTEAAEMQKALRSIGLSHVYLSAKDNLFASSEAKELIIALQGIAELENDRLMIAALSCRYFALDTNELYQLQQDENYWQDQRQLLTKLREIWLKKGFMAMALVLVHQHYQPDNENHERAMTNTLHLLELLQQATQKHRQPNQLIHYLLEQTTLDIATEAAELRLESDANLIRIVTLHGSKGLEYPIVFIPFASRYKDSTKFGNSLQDIHQYHDENSVNKIIQLGHYPLGIALAQQEAEAESIRLLYVAITRAKYRCYISVAPFADYYRSPLGKTLKLTKDNALWPTLESLANTSNDSITFTVVDDSLNYNTAKIKTKLDNSHVSAAQFSGKIERNWWLSSFSALTKNLRHGSSLPTERIDDVNQNSLDIISSHTSELRFMLKKGADSGNLLHDILEHTDFSQPLWQQAISIPLSRYGQLPQNFHSDNLISWLQQCLNAPIVNEMTLSHLTWHNTLRETEFYFPIKQANLNQLGQLLALHRSSSNSSNSRKKYDEHNKQQNNNELSDIKNGLLSLPGKNILNGMMHGFIDLVFVWQDKYYIADYKSTHLGDKYTDYQMDQIKHNIEDNYYDLQYLIYSLALHRYLQKSLPDYQFEQHFGGVFYLYLRGMQAEATTGTYQKQITVDEINKLEQLFNNDNDNHIGNKQPENNTTGNGE